MVQFCSQKQCNVIFRKTQITRVSSKRLMSKVTAYARLLRIPGIGALALPPVIGALTVGMFDTYNLILLFAIGAFSSVYGFILNDYADVELDKLIKALHGKPLVSGEISRKIALIISILLIFLTFIFIFILWFGKTFDNYKIMALICIILAGILGSIYNLYGKKIPGSDFFVAISMALVFLFGALSFGKPTIITWIIFVLTFNQTLHMNAVEGGIKDSDHDHLMDVKNIALCSGVTVDKSNILIPLRFKLFGMGIRLFSSVFLFLPFVAYGYEYSIGQIVLLLFLTAGMLFFSFRLLNIYRFDRDLIRKYIGVQSYLRYSLVPVMLIGLIGWMNSAFLIFFPIVWYIIFTPLLGEKLFKPRM